jgi:hypothetical protein
MHININLLLSFNAHVKWIQNMFSRLHKEKKIPSSHIAITIWFDYIMITFNHIKFRSYLLQ